jgi:transposase
MAVPLLSAITSPKHLIADKAYDADSLRNWLKTRRIKAVVPSTATRTVPYPLDRAVYRRRNLIERLFCRLKNWRRKASAAPMDDMKACRAGSPPSVPKIVSPPCEAFVRPNPTRRFDSRVRITIFEPYVSVA